MSYAAEESNATTDIITNTGGGAANNTSIVSTNDDDDDANISAWHSTDTNNNNSPPIRSYRKKLILGGIVAFTVFVVCFLFVGGMLLASGNGGGGHDDDATSNSASAATLPEEDVGDDVGGSNDGGAMTTTSSTGLRSSGAPSPEPIPSASEDITMAIIPTNEPTKMATDKPTEDAPTIKPTDEPTDEPSSKEAPIIDPPPTVSPSLRPSQLITLSKQSVVAVAESTSTTTSSTTQQPFSINIESWLEAFNELTSEEEAASTTTTAATEASMTSSTTSTRNFTHWVAAFEALALSGPSTSSISTSSVSTTNNDAATIPASTSTAATATAAALDATMHPNTCLTEEECNAQIQKMGFQYFFAGSYPLKGCFYKSEIAYFGEGGTAEEMSSDSRGQKIRIWCNKTQDDTGNDDDDADENLLAFVIDNINNLQQAATTLDPTGKPTSMPSRAPTKKPTPAPTKKPTPTPTSEPTYTPTLRPVDGNTNNSNGVQTVSPEPTTKPTPMPTSAPTMKPTPMPTSAPTMKPTPIPSSAPTMKPTLMPRRSPTMKPTPAPTTKPSPATTMRPNDPCFSVSTYESIDNDIGILKNNIADAQERSHFLGGIVRLVAHDFMDYDQNDANNPMGPDGCFNATHPANAGLQQGIWCPNCPLTLLYEERYSHLSRADYWIASANAVIRQTSVNNTLDLRGTFSWGRMDADSCPGQGARLPSPRGCGDVEHTFLIKMGLTWKDAVALMGAHTLGRGEREFSGHGGRWAKSDEDAQVFDKEYYEEMYLNSWRPRGSGGPNQDWTTGKGNGNTRLMLNTDMCLVYDVDDIATSPKCCSRTGWSYSDGTDHCIDDAAAKRSCPHLSSSHSRWEATAAVGEMLGGLYPNTNNQPFYDAFSEAWRKATTVGQDNLSTLAESCELVR